MFRSLILILLVMIILGWPCISMPFDGDEALFAVMGEECSRGAVLYRDQWDITNPGIIWFYQLAGTVVGFSEARIRAFEWCYWTVFMLVVSAAIRSHYQLTHFPLAPAILVAAVYYCGSYGTPFHLTKTEGLVGFPMFCALWCAYQAGNPGRNPWFWLILAGIAGGCVLLFKLMFLVCLVPVWFWLGVVFVRQRGSDAILPRIGLYACGLTLGSGMVFGLALTYFASQDVMESAWKTLVEYPPLYFAEGRRAELDRLIVSCRWFVSVYAGVAAIAIFAATVRWRKVRDPMVVSFCILLVTSGLVILAQRLSWWSYHFLLLGTPTGLLAAFCWPAVQKAARERLTPPLSKWEWCTSFIIALILFLPWIGSGTITVLQLSRHHFGLSPLDRHDFRLEVWRTYRVAEEECTWLINSESRSGEILVCGDPLFHLVSHRRPATAINAWSMELYPKLLREKLTQQFITKHPIYVYVDRRWYGYDKLIQERYPQLAQELASHYRIHHISDSGTWYEWLEPRPLSPRPE